MLRDKTKSFFVLSKTNGFLAILFLTFILVYIPQVNVIDYPNSTVTGKLVVFGYCCIALLLTVAFRIIKLKDINVSISNIDVALMSLMSFVFLNRYYFHSDYIFSIRFLELIGLILLYLLFRTIKIRTFYVLLLAIVLSGIIQAVYGNLQLLDFYNSNHSGFKMTGSFFNPGPYAGFLISVFPIALGLYLFREKVIENVQPHKKNKSFIYFNTIAKYVYEYMPLMGIVSIILVIPATQSRASWLAIVTSSCVLLELRYSVVKKLFFKLSKSKKIIVVGVSLLVIFTSLFGIYHFKKGSSDGRLFIWKVSTEIIKDNSVFGVGFDRFKSHYMNYQAEYFSKHGETKEALVADNSNYAFNELVQFTVENGFVGALFLFVLCFFILKVKTNEKNQFLGATLKISLLSIAVFASFSYPMQILPTKIVLFCSLAHLANLDSSKKYFRRTTTLLNKQSIFIKSVSFVLIIFISYTSYSYTNRLSGSFLTWKEGLEDYQYGNYKDAINSFEEVYPFFKNNGEFLMNYGKTLSIAKKNKKAIAILSEAKLYLNNTVIETAIGDAYKANRQYKNAEIAYTKAYNMIPVRFYPLYLLANLYDESNQEKKAIDIANKVLQKGVKIPSTAIKEIQLEMKKIINKKKEE